MFYPFLSILQNAQREQETAETKTDGSNGIVLLEARAGRFKCYGEKDVHTRHFQAARIGGTGKRRERCNLLGTAIKPPVAQRAGGIMTYILCGYTAKGFNRR